MLLIVLKTDDRCRTFGALKPTLRNEKKQSVRQTNFHFFQSIKILFRGRLFLNLLSLRFIFKIIKLNEEIIKDIDKLRLIFSLNKNY